MNFRDAMKAMLDGQKVTVGGMTTSYFLRISKNGALIQQNGFAAGISCDNVERNDWQIWQEPEPPLVDWDAALKALKEGKRVRRKHWRKDAFFVKRGPTCIENDCKESQNILRPVWLIVEDWQILED
jgi:hypothetical protein